MVAEINWVEFSEKIPRILEALAKLANDGTATERGFILLVLLVVAGLIIVALRSTPGQTSVAKTMVLVAMGVGTIVIMAGWGLQLNQPPSFRVGNELTFVDRDYQTPTGPVTKRGYLVRAANDRWLECIDDPLGKGPIQANVFRELALSADAAILVRKPGSASECQGEGVLLRLDFQRNQIDFSCVGDRGFQKFYDFQSYRRSEQAGDRERTTCDRPATAALTMAPTRIE